MADSSQPNSPGLRILEITVALEGGLLLISLGLARLSAVSLGTWWRAGPTDLALAAVACLPLLAAMQISIKLPFRPLRNFRQLIDEHLVPLFTSCSVLQMAIISLLAGMGEELLFRGLIQNGSQPRIGPWPAIVVASLLFGLAHAISTVYFAFATLIGVYLGWLCLATGTLSVPILTHALYDFLALIYLVRIRRPPGSAHNHGVT